MKGFVFKYEGRHIELVREFKYLGITVTASGGLYNAREKLRKQAYLPMLSVLQKINFDSTISLKLFDSLIKPILTYNCEHWSQISKYKLESLESNKISLEETYFDNPAEKLHLQFCRTVLGVSNKTSNLTTLGELSRYPLMLHCYVQMIKYWHHIKTTTPKDSPVYKFINCTEQSETQEHCRWLSTVKVILKLCNLNYVWEDPTKIKH